MVKRSVYSVLVMKNKIIKLRLESACLYLYIFYCFTFSDVFLGIPLILTSVE